MEIEYEIDEEFGGVPEGWKFEIDDTPEAESEWKVLLAAFESAFLEFTREDLEDFELADWHYEMRCVFACLYNLGFYKATFIPRVQQVLRNQTKECYAKFECYDQTKKVIGSFMVFKDKVIFDGLSEQTGLVKELVCSEKSGSSDA